MNAVKENALTPDTGDRAPWVGFTPVPPHGHHLRSIRNKGGHGEHLVIGVVADSF
jgi:hypothetical protein